MHIASRSKNKLDDDYIIEGGISDWLYKDFKKREHRNYDFKIK